MSTVRPARDMAAATPTALPTLFVSHGSPMFAVEAGRTGPALRQWAAQLPPPEQIVIMSPHWMTRQPTVMASIQPATLHDFGGFPESLYALSYPAPGAPALAQLIVERLAQAGIGAELDDQRPLDHGAWVPLMHLFPQARIPVTQVALPIGWGPQEVLQMGRALADLASQGVLIIGSGSMTHNLGEFFAGQRQAQPYVQAFSRWVEDALLRHDTEALLHYRTLAPHAVRAHPTDEHFLPLFFALGAARPQATPDYLSREVMYGILAMDALALSAAGPTDR